MKLRGQLTSEDLTEGALSNFFLEDILPVNFGLGEGSHLTCHDGRSLLNF